MGLEVTCFYCGTRKTVDSGNRVKLTCDRCSSSRIILSHEATIKCMLCGKTYTLPAGKQVTAYHDDPDCLGFSLVLIDYE